MSSHDLRLLQDEINRLHTSKLQLVRSTSTEIERLRRIICVLTGTDKVESIDSLKNEPLRPSQIGNYYSQSQLAAALDDAKSEAEEEQETTPISDEPVQEPEPEVYINRDAVGGLPDINEDEPADSEKVLQPSAAQKHLDKPNPNSDTLFRLSTKRMSYMGFEFSDFGFMTTDYDQLSRGHTSWVNQVLNHPVQNGICVSASDDWSVMFWRFRRSTGREELAQEKYDKIIQQFAEKSPERKRIEQEVYENQPSINVKHVTGEIQLMPVLKINTGLEVKSIQISPNGHILACTCYDDEEDEGNPELQLYFDDDQKWCFKAEDFNYDAPETDRVIKRKIIPLDFEPVPRALCFTRDSRIIFVAVFSTRNEVKQYREDNPDDEDYPEEACTLVAVDTITRMVLPCTRVTNLMYDDEYVTSLAISRDGVRIAMGTNHGRLIVTGTHSLMDRQYDPTANPELDRLWITDEEDTGESKAPDTDEPPGPERSLTALQWSEDYEWIVAGYGSGFVRIWKKNAEARMSVATHKVLSFWMKKAKILRKSKLFECKYTLDNAHLEAVNDISLRGSMMVSGSDDGTVVIHDLLNTFIDDIVPISTVNNGAPMDINAQLASQDSANAPIEIYKLNKLHGGRMVNSVSLSKNYNDDKFLIPSAGLFLISSGADNVVHSLSVLDTLRHAIRKRYYGPMKNQS